MQQATAKQENLDLAAMAADLNNLLRLKTTVIVPHMSCFWRRG